MAALSAWLPLLNTQRNTIKCPKPVSQLQNETSLMIQKAPSDTAAVEQKAHFWLCGPGSLTLLHKAARVHPAPGRLREASSQGPCPDRMQQLHWGIGAHARAFLVDSG